MAQGKHTILLLQTTSDKRSRTFMDFETASAAMNGAVTWVDWTRICQLFERKLKELNPNLRNITYDISDLYKYIDSLPDMSCLVYEPSLNAYQPFNKDWIKKRTFQLLKKQAM